MTEGVREYAAGFVAGIATVLVGHPFDTIKVKLQAHNTRTSERTYKNALHCAVKILSTEGVQGLYNGATSSFVGMALESSLFFGLYSQLKKLLQGEEPSSKPCLLNVVPAACCSGAASSVILCPTELIKCRMQTHEISSSDSNYRRINTLQSVLATLRKDGILGPYRGYLATLLRESIGNAFFFTAYEYSRYYMYSKLGPALDPGNRHQKAAVEVGLGIISGGFSGIAFWCAVLPLDVAKTVIQTSKSSGINADPFQTLRMIYARVGLRGCYAGLGPTLMRAFPANAAAIVAWEVMAKVLGTNCI